MLKAGKLDDATALGLLKKFVQEPPSSGESEPATVSPKRPADAEHTATPVTKKPRAVPKMIHYFFQWGLSTIPSKHICQCIGLIFGYGLSSNPFDSGYEWHPINSVAC